MQHVGDLACYVLKSVAHALAAAAAAAALLCLLAWTETGVFFYPLLAPAVTCAAAAFVLHRRASRLRLRYPQQAPPGIDHYR